MQLKFRSEFITDMSTSQDRIALIADAAALMETRALVQLKFSYKCNDMHTSRP